MEAKLLRLKDVLAMVPVSKSTWWKWVATSKAPKPLRLGRITCWRSVDIMAFIEEGR